MRLIQFAVLLFSFNLFAFEGVITYSQTDLKDGKQIPSITKSLSAYFYDDLLVRLKIEYDSSKFKISSQDIYLSHAKGTVVRIETPGKTYSQSELDKSVKPNVMPSKQTVEKTILNHKTSLYTFPDKYSAVKTKLYYSESLKMKPQPYLLSGLGSMSWALNPETGAVAMMIHMYLDKDSERIIEVTKIEAKKLKPAEYLPKLQGYSLKN